MIEVVQLVKKILQKKVEGLFIFTDSLNALFK